MFQLGKTIVSEDILEKDFVCNLSACHGACCVDGDAGAPLSEAETKILEEIYPKVKPFLRKEGIEAIEKLGTWVVGTDQDLETPLIDNKDCAYVIFDGDKAELFLDTQKDAIMLVRKSEGESWINGDYILIPWKGYVLKKGENIEIKF